MDLSGLGGALGAAAGGYLTGRNRGEAELYRRGRLEADRAQKQAALDAAAEARRQQLALGQERLGVSKDRLRLARDAQDPAAKARDWAGQRAQHILDLLSDPTKAADFNTPWGRKQKAHLMEQATRLIGVRNGDIDPKDIDPVSIAFGDIDERDPAQETAQRLPFLREPGTALAPPPGDLGGAEAMPEKARGAFYPEEGPPEPALPPRIGPPDVSAALGPRSKPPTPRELYDQAVANPPVRQALEGETPKQTEDRYQKDLAAWDRRVGLLRDNVLLGSRERKGAADATRSEGKAKIEPRLDAAALEGKKTATGLGKEQARQIRATLPINVAKGKESIATSRQNRKLAPKREARAERAQTHREKVDDERLRQGRERMADTRAYRAQLAEKAKRALARKAGSEKAALLQKRVQTNLAILTRLGPKDAAGRQPLRFSETRQALSQEELEADLETLRKIERQEPMKGGTPPAATAAPRTAPKGGDGGITEAELKHVRGIGKAGYKAWVSGLPAAAQVRAKKAASILGWR